MDRRGHRVKLVNDFKPRLISKVIDARNVEQIIEGKFVAAELRHLPDITGVDDKCRLTAKLDLLRSFGSEMLSSRGENFRASHGKVSEKENA